MVLNAASNPNWVAVKSCCLNLINLNKLASTALNDEIVLSFIVSSNALCSTLNDTPEAVNLAICSI